MRSYLFVRQALLISCFLCLSLAGCAPEIETVVPATRRPAEATTIPAATIASPSATAEALPLLVTPTMPLPEPSPIVASAVITATSTTTATPVPTLMPTIVYTPVATLPAHPLAISPENAAAVTQLAQFGKGTIYSIEWSRDGSTLAVASSTGIHLYDPKTLELLSSLDSDTPILDVILSPQGEMAAVVSQTMWGSAEDIMDVATGQIVSRIGEDIPLSNEGRDSFVAFSADGQTYIIWRSGENTNGGHLAWLDNHMGEVRRVLALSQPPLTYSLAAEIFLDPEGFSPWRRLHLIDGISGDVKRTIEAPSDVSSAALSSQGDMLATSSGNDIQLWDVQSGEVLHVLEGNTNRVDNIAFGPDGRLLATGGYESKVRLWDTASGQLLHTLPVGRWGGFSPDGRELTIMDLDKVQFYDTTNGQLLRTLTGYSSSIAGIAFSPDGKMLAVTVPWNQAVWLWDVSSGQLIHTIEGGEYLSTVAFSRDGRLLAWGDNRRLQLYDIETDRLVGTLGRYGGDFGRIVFSADGRIITLVEGVRNNSPQEWLFIPSVGSLAFHPNGHLLAIEGGNGVQISDLATLQVLRTFPDFHYPYAFSLDGQLLVRQGSVAGLLDVDTGQFTHPIEDVGGKAALSPDGRILAGNDGSGESNAVVLWDVNTGRRLRELEGHTSFFDVVFSRDGQWLASGGSDGTVRLWGLPSGTR